VEANVIECGIPVEAKVAQNQEFDTVKAHRYFSAQCFNKAWELLEKPNRTSDEDEQMVRLNQASTWHWTQREDCKPRNLSIGYWQASRIHAVVGRPDEARRYAQLCLEYSRQEPPFYLAYAYEALARAEKTAGNERLMQEYKEEAARLADRVTEANDRQLLVNDLESL
jgi:hypothetical protein